MRPELVETWNGLGNTPSLFKTLVSINAACNHESFYIINLISPYIKLFFKYNIVFIPCMEILLIICLCLHLLGRRGNNHFDVHFRRIGPYFFCRKMEKTRSVREEVDGRVFNSRQSRHLLPLINNMIEVLFPICTLIWRVNNYVSRQGKV